MIVSELIEKLQKMNPELQIILSRDEEGNGYEYLRYIDDNCVYDDREVYLAELTEECKKQGFEEDDVREGTRVVLLSP